MHKEWSKQQNDTPTYQQEPPPADEQIAYVFSGEIQGFLKSDMKEWLV